ncbi:hypothetical protein [Luteibacter sp. dw_328]|uniref:hypothetical protein n=1 Tax=Luteibacter sp. dw_328 TaxID=2719796 RepID=UPI001BD3BEC1|nr:hypothetical protein [Luteibacter sp. dw_328]
MKRVAVFLTYVGLPWLATIASAQQSPQTDLSLICPGVGEHLESHTSYDSEWDSKHHKYVDTQHNTLDPSQVQGTAQIEIHQGQGRIRPPKRLIPPISSGGQDGWWPLTDIDVSPDRIRASCRLNGLNHPKVDIDRRTGEITIDGIEKFEGNCKAVDAAARQF